MIGRVRFRLQIRYAVAIVTAAYLYRGFVIRGGDLSPDLPQDALAFGLGGALFALVWFLRRSYAADEPESISQDVDDDDGDERCSNR